MAKLVGKRYAEALFEVALEYDKLEEYKQEIIEVSKVFESEPKLKTIFEHPKLTKNEKKDIINSLFKGKISQEILNLLYIVVDKGRERYLSYIKDEYVALSNEKLGIIEAKAVTAVPMTEEEKSKLQDNLSNKFGKRVILENIVNEEIIGGVLVKIEDKVIDNSIKGQLDNIEKELKNVKVEKIGVKS
ncbi:F0F1 ATP synthase subunit delta [Caldisalinibacter kiritimatiensis]|uniref:ATP synthase subunit delta n=1 Tax=Caldisalinibacter kiritimatiensis TaxID=1304284 RepID=R1CAW1_9FIRM|nr:F0F1 ATP synthase subunit delta [Caldisalinibacter kiritimatiensis]EOC99449.1 ATP synthase delta chain [Caldisalinibacter kiritimatiensis]